MAGWRAAASRTLTTILHLKYNTSNPQEIVPVQAPQHNKKFQRLQTRRTCAPGPDLLATPGRAPGPRAPAQPQPGPREPALGPLTVPEVERVNGSLVTPVAPLESRALLGPPTWHLRLRTLRIPDARDPKWSIPTEKTL